MEGCWRKDNVKVKDTVQNQGNVLFKKIREMRSIEKFSLFDVIHWNTKSTMVPWLCFYMPTLIWSEIQPTLPYTRRKMTLWICWMLNRSLDRHRMSSKWLNNTGQTQFSVSPDFSKKDIYLDHNMKFKSSLSSFKDFFKKNKRIHFLTLMTWNNILGIL